MEYVVNETFGGFYIPDAALSLMDGYCVWEDGDDIRTHPALIDWVKNHEDETDLAVVTIPEEATDWELDEYDGAEHIIAVVDGKIVHIYGED